MRNGAAGLNAINIVEDPTIALQAKRDERAAISRMTELAERDKAEHNAMMSEFQNSMSQFSKLDIDPDDVNRVQQIETEERKKVVEALRKHDGNIVQFMRSGGGKGILAQYANKVRNSPEYQDAVQMGQWYKLADTAIQKGEVPHDVNVGTPEQPNWVPAHVAVKMRKDGQLNMPLAWAGSYKPLNFGDLVQKLRFVTNDLPVARQLHPNELRTLLREQGQSESHVNKMVDVYQRNMFDDGLVGKAGKDRSKHALWLDGNRDLIAIEEAEKNRQALNYRASLTAGDKPIPLKSLSDISFQDGTEAVEQPKAEVTSYIGSIVNGKVLEVKDHQTPQQWNDIVESQYVGSTPDLLFIEDANGMYPVSLTGNVNPSRQFNENITARAISNGKGVLKEGSSFKIGGLTNKTRVVKAMDSNGQPIEVIYSEVYVDVPKSGVADKPFFDSRSPVAKGLNDKLTNGLRPNADDRRIKAWLPLPVGAKSNFNAIEAQSRSAKNVENKSMQQEIQGTKTTDERVKGIK
jgi:hypothetical protein